MDAQIRKPLTAVLLALALGACTSTPVSRVPVGFALIYSQDFEDEQWLTEFTVSDPSVWGPGRLEDNGTCELRGPGRHAAVWGGPADFALLDGVTVGDFLLEFDVWLVGDVRELSVFFGVEQPERFVYASLAPRASTTAHDVFRVDHAKPLGISSRRSFGVPLTPGIWQHVTVLRQDLPGRVVVALGTEEQTVVELEARNGALAPGWLGFGVAGGGAHFDHVRLYAPDYSMRSLEHLPAAGQSRR